MQLDSHGVLGPFLDRLHDGPKPRHAAWCPWARVSNERPHAIHVLQPLLFGHGSRLLVKVMAVSHWIGLFCGVFWVGRFYSEDLC